MPGEASGLASIEEAVQVCDANRIGHGVAIMEDITLDESGAAQLGGFAAYVRNERICLEMCPYVQCADWSRPVDRRASHRRPR